MFCSGTGTGPHDDGAQCLNTAEMGLMIAGGTDQQSACCLESEFDRTIHEFPAVAGFLIGFKELFVEQEAWKTCLPSPAEVSVTVDRDALSRGVPVWSIGDFAVPPELMKEGAQRLIPAMQRGFPQIGEQLETVRRFMERSDAWALEFHGKAKPGDDQPLRQLSHMLDVELDVVKFVFGQVWKTCASRRVESLNLKLGDRDWRKGYCPMCGSWPEIGFLDGNEGRRLLRCSFCGYEWKFMRIRCPFCENEDQRMLDLLFSEDRKFEWAELCRACMTYLVSIDLRGSSRGVAHEIASLALVYLDVLAQEKGFLPVAGSGSIFS